MKTASPIVDAIALAARPPRGTPMVLTESSDVGTAGDYVKCKRLKHGVELEQEYRKLLSNRGVKAPIDPSPSIAIPF